MNATDVRTARGWGRGDVRSTTLSTAQRRYLRSARWMARFMDARWGIGPLRFGAETLVDLIPGVGDFFSIAVSIYQLWVGIKLGLPGRKLARMLVNTGLDFGFGLVPFAGDAVDTLFKAHVRNQRIIDGHVARLEQTAGPAAVPPQ